MALKTKKIQFIFFIYWFLLAYVIAALVFWFLALSHQNEKMHIYQMQQLNKSDANYQKNRADIQQDNKRKKMQYAGEGGTFLLVLLAGAIFVFRSVKKQLQLSRQQQNFMIAVTHELKTPVAISKLNLETLQKRKLEPVQQQRLMQNTLQEINRLDALCNNMLVSSQIEAGAYNMLREEVNLNQLCCALADDFSQRFTSRKINCIDYHEILFINADVVLIQIALSNLLENALKYSPRQSEVDMVLTTDKLFASIQIKDKGPGIEEEEKKKVFKKFYRLGNEATRSAKGTGLGLYLTQNIIDAHKGKINIEENPGGGSIFIVLLPLA